MNKRKVKKKFKLTCKEFRVMTMNNPNIFKGVKMFLYGSYSSSCLEEAIFFWKGKRIGRDDYFRLLKNLEKSSS